ncbi:hypothetical protein BY458DRAFT_569913 [Sporodiniella umbellata]|nr:hypothetical protein BY458DRAFT_569913 [Sporodiniella umbellata]
MKLNTILGSLVAASLLWFQMSAKEILLDNYSESKHIMFMSTFGGSSHVSWVLSILDELSKRGHRITYVTREFQSKHAKSYPHIRTIILDGKATHMEKSLALKRTTILEAASDLLYSGYNDFHTDAKAPYINNHILTMEYPTTLEMAFWHRFYDMLVVPVKGYLGLKPVGNWINEKRQSSGCNVTDHEYEPWTHKNSLKIVNSLFGIEAARPFGPLVEMVGPIMQRHYNPLTVELRNHLDQYNRILYIAFGQHAVASIKDLHSILTGIMEGIESEVYDGFLWSSRKGPEYFPKEIKTSSGTIYSVQTMFDGGYPNLRFESWVPQTAVVMHPSVSVFLTHGGAGSMYEGLFAGKRLLVFPFFGDQFLNAQNVKRRGLGEFLSPKLKQEETNTMIKHVGEDIDGDIQGNVNRYKALIQIHSKNGPVRGADLVEEVLFVHKNTYLPYRYEDSREMSFVKSHNIDILVVLFFMLLSSVYISIVVMKKISKVWLANLWAQQLPDDTKMFKLKTP